MRCERHVIWYEMWETSCESHIYDSYRGFFSHMTRVIHILSYFIIWHESYDIWDEIRCLSYEPPKNGLFALWPSTNGAIPYFLVLPGSELSITEITEYIYFSPLKPCREFKYKSEYNTVPVKLIFECILFLWNIIFTFYYTRVRPQCDYSILGRMWETSHMYYHTCHTYYLYMCDNTRCGWHVCHLCDMCGMRDNTCVPFVWHKCIFTHAIMRLTTLRADSRGTPTARGRQYRMSKERTRGEWDWGVENKNTQINLNKQKLSEPQVYLKPVEQTLYSATVPIQKGVLSHMAHMAHRCDTHVSIRFVGVLSHMFHMPHRWHTCHERHTDVTNMSTKQCWCVGTHSTRITHMLHRWHTRHICQLNVTHVNTCQQCHTHVNTAM